VIYLLDANLLLRLVEPTHHHHAPATEAVRLLRAQGVELRTASQSFYEFWTVATRPGTSRGGLGFSPSDASRAVNRFEALFPLLPDVPLYIEWKRLVSMWGVSGKESHDARLVAAMLKGGIHHILTFNGKDFARYAAPASQGEGITVVDPVALVANPASSPPPP
jgi:predicted nucleic acid-binding protein